MRDQYRVLEPIAVRWADMDSFGHVNNAKYFTYCESARMTWFAEIDLDAFKDAETHGPALVSASCDFLKQVHHPADLEVGVRVVEVGRKSFTHEYMIFSQGSDELVAKGTGVIVWVDYAVGKAIPLPEALKARMRDFDGLSE